jgi:hypothetical protein
MAKHVPENAEKRGDKYNWEDILFPILAFFGIIGFSIFLGFRLA